MHSCNCCTQIKKEYIVYKEGLIQSILSDVFTFGCIMGLEYFNYKYLGNTWYIGVFILISILVFVVARTDREHQFRTLDELKKYVNNLS